METDPTKKVNENDIRFRVRIDPSAMGEGHDVPLEFDTTSERPSVLSLDVAPGSGTTIVYPDFGINPT